MRVVRAVKALRGEEIAIRLLEAARPDSSALESINNIPRTVLAGDSDLLGSLRHLGCGCVDERWLSLRFFRGCRF